MTVTAAQLAQLVHGTLEGDPEATVRRPARIEEAVDGDFAFLDNPRYESFAYSTQASVLMVHEDFAPAQAVKPTLLRVKDVRSSLAFLLGMFGSNGTADKGISEKALVHARAKVGAGATIGEFTVIEEGAQIGPDCLIYPQVFIGKNARIGAGSILYPGVRVHYDCEIGENCILHANAVIGADGFGFAPQPDKTWKKVPQVGNVVLENNVEIGACTCIDRAALGSTLVRAGAKIDNLVHVAHNVEVGQNTVIAAQAGVAGSSKIGENVQLGGQVGIAGHISIADGTRLQAQSGVASSIKEPGTALFGSPAFAYTEFIRSHVVFKNLPALEKRVRELERRLEEMGADNQ